MTARPSLLLVTNNFPPVRGGSAAVYASLVRCARTSIMVLAPRLNYVDGLPLIGWREYDRMAQNRVVRLPLLRTVLGTPEGALARARFVLKDVMLRSRVAWLVLRLVAAERPRAVCVGELLASGWIVRLLSYVPGLRTLVYVHGEEITTDYPHDRGFARRRHVLMLADRIIVVSRFTQRAVLDRLGESQAGRIVLIENGVDTSRFRPAARDPELMARYRLAGHFVFITVCRLLEKKGVDQALHALARLLPAYPDTRYLVVGSGPHEGHLHALADALGLRDAVIFAGDVPDHALVDHYRLGDVFLMPNRALPDGDTEGFGLVFLEANGCGLPVIAGRDGGSTDAVRDGENGLVVDGNSVTAIHAAMQRLRGDAALRARLGQRGLAAAAAADWTNRADAFMRVCEAG